MHNITRKPARTLRTDLGALWSTMTGPTVREGLTFIWLIITGSLALALIAS